METEHERQDEDVPLSGTPRAGAGEDRTPGRRFPAAAASPHLQILLPRPVQSTTYIDQQTIYLLSWDEVKLDRSES